MFICVEFLKKLIDKNFDKTFDIMFILSALYFTSILNCKKYVEIRTSLDFNLSIFSLFSVVYLAIKTFVT